MQRTVILKRKLYGINELQKKLRKYLQNLGFIYNYKNNLIQEGLLYYRNKKETWYTREVIKSF